jgi:hypothetical protein
MNKKCPHCTLVNYATVQDCIRCGKSLGESQNIAPNSGFLNSSLAKRTVVCIGVLFATVAGFYGSLVFSADALKPAEQEKIRTAIAFLEEKGFHDEVFLLRHVAVYRANDNWLNASVQKETAYAATNFPFEVVTIYPEFFKFANDEVEMAAILLHEAKHLQGYDEPVAYEYVWKNRERLGWTIDEYSESEIWRETRKLTKEYVPMLFVCKINDYSDCTG